MSGPSTGPSTGAVAADRLAQFATRALGSLGVPDRDASAVAALMVEADLLGYDTHGLFRLRQYVNRLRDGGCNPVAEPRILRETAATALVDGDNGLGHLALAMARDLAMAKARTAGIGWVGVRGGNHAGPAALYVRPQAAAGMIGICAAVGSANHVAPYGGTDLLLGTNPIAIATPGGADPFVLDMATTVAAVGKIKTLAQRGEPMPEGWMVGRDGKPLTDPNRRDEGFLLPIGGAKGYGLAMAIGLMAGVLNGAAFGSDVVDFTTDTTSPTNTGQFVAAIDIAAFGDPDLFTKAASRIFAEMRASTPLPGHDPVRVPGDGREAARAARLADGIALHPALLAELDRIANDLAIAPL
ncbi:Ldh family oxidoreductase [Tabrizicola piscis]|uniref:Ldh family oxidoreductase n=1 Tax=Tabrizicola piscis TaxID=2494374 RepID=A0A3S8U6Z7_9RHOB|nr:Ldh family oxidoreductase [Tabrizicola piscis]AZL59363.1 Ldh family oxidoreductase [Tabrizicola piscis]